MSKRFLTKVAGGVALGSAALLLGAPATALADPAPEAESEDTVQVYSHKRGDKKGDKKRDHKRDHKREQNTFYVKDRGGEIYTCQLVEQDSEAKVRNVIGDVDLSGSSNTTVTVIPFTPAIAPNVNLTGLVICFRDIDVDLTADVDVDLGLLDGLPPIDGGILAQPFQANGLVRLGISSLLSLGWLEELVLAACTSPPTVSSSAEAAVSCLRATGTATATACRRSRATATATGWERQRNGALSPRRRCRGR